jgi:predicted dehydrogenase
MANRGSDVTHSGVPRLGVIGAGSIGARHAHLIAATAGCELAAVIDPNKAARTTFKAQGFATIDDVDVSLDGVIIATPTELHGVNGEAAAARRWHLLIEKPVTGTLAEADRLIEAVKATKVTALIGHHRRHHASVQRLRALIAEGAIGQPVLASMIWAVKKPEGYFDAPWRAGDGGSPVMINLVHDIDILRFVLGEITSVTAVGGQPVRGAGRVESGVAVLSFANGCIASCSFSDTTPSPWGFEAATSENPYIASTGEDMLRIIGTKGSVSFPSLTVWSGAKDWSEAPHNHIEGIGETNALAAQLAHFIDIIEGRTEPLIDAADGRATLAAALQVEAAIAGSL